jgi:hypothetical protein
MSLDTQLPEGRPEKFTSPNLRLRDSMTIWGPLQIAIHRHRQGAELGYPAGEEAYQTVVCAQRQGNISADMLEHYMACYLTTPKYRPRALTEQIAAEWRAMFILGWTSQLLQDLVQRDTDDQTERHSYAAKKGCGSY